MWATCLARFTMSSFLSFWVTWQPHVKRVNKKICIFKLHLFYVDYACRWLLSICAGFRRWNGAFPGLKVYRPSCVRARAGACAGPVALIKSIEE